MEKTPLNIDQVCLDQASLAVYRHDVDGRFTYVNQTACDQTGYSKDELCCMSLFDLDPVVTRQKHETLWQTLSEEGTAEFESIHQRKDGTRFPVKITSNPVEFDGQTFSVSFVKNISSREKTTQALHLTQFCFDHAPIAIFRIEASTGQIVDANHMACEKLGYTKEDLCCLDIFDIDPNFPEEKWNAHIKSIPTGRAKTIESMHQHKDGRVFPVEIVINSIEFKGTQYHLAFATDISERKFAEKEKSDLKTRLIQSQKMEAIGTLAGGIAHDFNNILSGIFGYCRLAEIHANTPSKTKNYITQILNGAQRAAQLVQQILAFSRQSEYKKQPLAVFILLKEALKLLRPSIPSTIEIREKNLSNAAVMADPTHIHQVIMNLCTNAYQAMREKGGVLTVGLDEIDVPGKDNIVELNMAPGKYLRLEVSDTGDGMDDKTLDKIFDPYFTTKGMDKGTGLGLSVVHGIVEDHKGYVKVYSRQNQGTCFYVFLPVLEKKPFLTALGNTDGTSMAGTETIMVVDDEESIRCSLQEFLEDQGYRIHSFVNGKEAFQAFKNDPHGFDLIITDVTMPLMTGRELAAAILTIRPELPVILCSGYSEKRYRDKAADPDRIKYLQKPIILDRLSRMIREELDRNSPEGKN